NWLRKPLLLLSLEPNADQRQGGGGQRQREGADEPAAAAARPQRLLERFVLSGGGRELRSRGWAVRELGAPLDVRPRLSLARRRHRAGARSAAGGAGRQQRVDALALELLEREARAVLDFRHSVCPLAQRNAGGALDPLAHAQGARRGQGALERLGHLTRRREPELRLLRQTAQD